MNRAWPSPSPAAQADDACHFSLPRRRRRPRPRSQVAVPTTCPARPWQYLARNEALLTNGTGMTGEPEAQARFVARLKPPARAPWAMAETHGAGPQCRGPRGRPTTWDSRSSPEPASPGSAPGPAWRRPTPARETPRSHDESRLLRDPARRSRRSRRDRGGPGQRGPIGARMFLVDPTDGSTASGSPASAFAVGVRGPGCDRFGRRLHPDPPLGHRTVRGRGRGGAVPLDDQPPVALLIEAADQDLPNRTLLQHVATARITIGARRCARRPTSRSAARSWPTCSPAGWLRDGQEVPHQHGLDPARAIVVAARRTAPPGAARRQASLPHRRGAGSRHVAALGRGRCHVLVDCGTNPRLDGLAVCRMVVDLAGSRPCRTTARGHRGGSRWRTATARSCWAVRFVAAGDSSTWPLPAGERRPYSEAGDGRPADEQDAARHRVRRDHPGLAGGRPGPLLGSAPPAPSASTSRPSATDSAGSEKLGGAFVHRAADDLVARRPRRQLLRLADVWDAAPSRSRRLR